MDQIDIPLALAEYILIVCEEHKIVSQDGAVDLEMTEDGIAEILDSEINTSNRELFEKHRVKILKAILKSRYSNLYSLLQHHVAEDTYLGIVQNKILVDVQGEDVSYA